MNQAVPRSLKLPQTRSMPYVAGLTRLSMGRRTPSLIAAIALIGESIATVRPCDDMVVELTVQAG